MKKLAVLSILLIAALAASIGCNIYQMNQNSSQAAEIDMNNLLSQAQVGINSEIDRMSTSLVYACGELSNTGLNGDDAKAVLTALAANSTYIIDAGTVDLTGTVVTMVPAAYSNMSGVYIGQPDGMNTNSKEPIKATLFDVYPLTEGFSAATMMAPVFDAAGNRIGAVSISFKPSAVINATVTPLVAGTPYSMWAMQKDSLEIYDPDPAQEGLIIFQDSMYQKYSAVFGLVHQIADTPSGQSSYQFPKTLDSSEMLTKQCMWTTIGGYGTEWRLIIVHAV